MKKRIVFLLSFAFLIWIPGIMEADIPAGEREALIALYNSTNGAGWTDSTNWNGSAGSENTWYGITCNGANTTVLEIKLQGNNLSGTIPPELGNLPNLTELFLYSNNLTGNIPSELGNLTGLEEFLSAYNQLSGSIPPQLGNISTLYKLNLGRNQLSGEIPAELGNLSGISQLTLAGNQLTGSIPGALGNLSNANSLFLEGNELSGEIPAGLAGLTNVERLYLDGNNLTGSIPSWIDYLEDLEILRLGNNRLSGPIPSQLGNLSNLRHLFLEGNRLAGNIPASMENLSTLNDNGCNFKWNGLYTDDNSLRAFLSAKQNGGDWESTQTVAPADVAAAASGYDSIEVTWTPVDYTADPGSYSVFYSAVPGEPYELAGTTVDKSADQMEVTGLNEGTTYYFVVQTLTDPHLRNDNTVFSNYSMEVSAVTLGDGISGYVLSPGGQGVADVTLTFSNGGGTAVTNGDGYYTQSVDHGWSGTVTPSGTGYTFNPASRTYSNINGSLTNENYTAAEIFPVISGRAVDGGGTGVPDVTLAFSNGGGTVVTDAGGNYSQTVTYGWSGTVTPSKTGYTVDPASRTYSDVTGDLSGEDYTAAAITPEISGRVRDGGGTGIADVTLTFSNNGGTVTTDSDGNYSHTVGYSWSGTVTPSKTGYTIDPGSRTYSDVTGNLSGEDYTAAAITPVISGRTADGGGTGIADVTLTFSNSGGTVTTNGNGDYSQAIAYGWSGTVTPSKTGYTFAPGSLTYSNVTSDQSGQNYTATAVIPVISGRVADGGGNGISNVTVTFSDGGGSVVTNGNGDYSQTVVYGWSGTATPSKTGYTFDPGNRSYDNVISGHSGENYTATAIIPVISGRVTDAAGSGMAGVTITFKKNNNIVTSVATDSGGNYSHAVEYGWSGIARPDGAGYQFTPGTRIYTNVTADQTGQDYAAAILNYTISGRVTDENGTPFAGVDITFSALGTGVTDTDGNYARVVPYGWSGTVTPSKEGYRFEPVSRSYTDVVSGFTGQDYVAAAVTPVISGRITDSGGTGIPGVALSFSNGGGTAFSDANGIYSHAVVYNWSGTVTPSKEGFTFDPAARTFDGVTTDRGGEDFTAAAVTPVVSGRVSDENGTGIYEVNLAFSDGAGNVTDVSTDANGNYIHAVPYGWSGVVNLSKTGFSFEPQGRSYTNVTADRTGENYNGTAITPLISGRVTDGGGVGVFGVTLLFSNDGGSVTTNSSGNYLHAVPFGWSGTATPSAAGYTFEPGMREYDGVVTPQPQQDYTATAITPVISGRVVTGAGMSAAGVTVTASPGASVVTDADGIYRLPVAYGWSGTVTPSLKGFNFVPAHQSYSDVTVDFSGQDYTAVPDVTIDLQVSRETARAWIIRRDYGIIEFTVENEGELDVSKYILYRKTGSGTRGAFEVLHEYLPAYPDNNRFSYEDTYLEKGMNYTYKVEALDFGAEVLGGSGEITI
ncbi:MAG: hypothetical protein GY950_26415 [bacterium]|nr:hypothetical protein [bacterium]